MKKGSRSVGLFAIELNEVGSFSRRIPARHPIAPNSMLDDEADAGELFVATLVVATLVVPTTNGATFVEGCAPTIRSTVLALLSDLAIDSGSLHGFGNCWSMHQARPTIAADTGLSRSLHASMSA